MATKNVSTKAAAPTSKVMGKDFDFEAIRRGRQARKQRGGASLSEQLAEISPHIADLKPGQTVAVEMPQGYAPEAKSPIRNFTMSITAKITNLTAAGGEWAGRQFDIVSDDAEGNGTVYILRNEDTKEPPKLKRRGPKAANA